jgi:hypothetical protein
MGKYIDVQTDVFSVLASVNWSNENIPTFPQNFVITGNLSEFVRVTIISSGPALSEISTSGVLIAEIFAASNAGPTRSLEIADKLDSYLSRKTLNTSAGKTTQLFQSSLRFDGPDSDNPGLVRSTLSVPFSYFGVV